MNTSTDNFSITLHPSKALLASQIFLYLLAIISILFIAIPTYIKLIVITAIILVAVYIFKKHILFSLNKSITHLSCSRNGKCRVELKDGEVCQAKIANAEWLFNYFAVLVLKNNTNRFKITIAKDTLSQEQFYALRLYLQSLNNYR